MAQTTGDGIGELAAASGPDVQATFCATLVDEWISRGVRHAVVAPGSRSTPLAIAVTDRSELDVQVLHDERSAAFVALGLGLPDPAGVAAPALLICTSGTATANFAPAVVEAGMSEVPMLVLTADRPPELQGVGAPQTIDQAELYGRHVRWFRDPGVPSAEGAGGWRRLAATAWRQAARGPVHLNLPFREPLLGAALALPPAVGADAAESGAVSDGPARPDGPVPDGIDRQRGVILAGGASGVDPEAVAELHRRTDWPVLADPTSGMRQLTGAVSTVDALLRHETFAADHAPDVVIRIGRPAASKVLAQWTARPDLVLVQVGGPGRIDPAHNVTASCSVDALLAADLRGASGTTWMARWRHADRRANDVIAAALGSGDDLSEPAVARLVADSLPAGAGLTVSSSMPVRDLEWYGGPTARAHANRGANGIDGVLATALGRALRRRAAGDASPEFVLVGDLAFVHDSNALVGLEGRGVDLRIVVVDNDGGGIFSFLPQRTALAPDRFERLFGTPLGVDVAGLAAACGVPAATVTDRETFLDHLARPGPWVVRVPTDREANVAEHGRLHAAVAEALG